MPKRSRKVQPFRTAADLDRDDPILAAKSVLERVISRSTIDPPAETRQRIQELQRVCREVAEFARAGGLPQRVIDVLVRAGSGGPIDPAFLLPITPEDFPESPAAALGRKGGLKGGHARAKSMTVAERRQSAIKAARARWRKKT
jgi:hypothetical protein